MAILQNKTNLLQRTQETWRPIAFRPVNRSVDRLMAYARRFFDIQAASLWRDLKDVLPNVSGSVVDVGCGAQPYRSLFPKGAAYRGIDTSDALAHFDYQVPDTVYYSGDRWPIDDSSCDFLLCSETLEHVPRPGQFLLEAARCLKPGGQICLTVPFAARWHYIPHDYWRFTPSGVRRLLEGAGFTGIAVYARGNEITVAAYKTMALLLRLIAPQTTSRPLRLCLQLFGVFLFPAFVVSAAVAQLSLTAEGGDDCLGYTVLATRGENVTTVKLNAYASSLELTNTIERK